MRDEPLKTLKEITTPILKLKDHRIDLCWAVSKQDLRAEAIRWVKYLNGMPKSDANHKRIAREQKKWIINFFNLTEEDLR